MNEALIREIAIYCQQRGLGVFITSDPDSRTIWAGEMPADAVEALMLINVDSPPPHQYVDTEYPIIDFWYRSPYTERANEMMRLIQNTFHRRENWTTDNYHIYLSQALGSPVDVDRDNEGGKLLRLSIQFISRNLNNVS
jgi:hypothetical protein